MEILEAIQKGKEFRTKSGYRAKFIALLPENIPARIVMDVYYRTHPFAGSKYEDHYTSSNTPTFDNYYIDGKHVSPYESHMDLMVDEL
jgi:hypothetical protein